MESCPAILYKYFPPERYSFFNDPMIRYTPFKSLNDPFEARPRFSSAPVATDREETTRGLVDALNRVGFGNEEKASLLKEIGKVLDAQRDEVVAHRDAHYKQLCNLDLGVLSLTETYDDILMWSHYAKNHSGFVIGFDMRCDAFFDKISNENLFGKPVRIIYSNERVNIAPCLREDCVPSLRCPLEEDQHCCLRDKFTECITKSTHWEYEKEWRVLMDNISRYKNNGVLGLRQIPSQHIKEVYVGLNSDIDLINCAMDFCERNNLILNIAMMHETNFQLVF